MAGSPGAFATLVTTGQRLALAGARAYGIPAMDGRPSIRMRVKRFPMHTLSGVNMTLDAAATGRIASQRRTSGGALPDPAPSLFSISAAAVLD